MLLVFLSDFAVTDFMTDTMEEIPNVTPGLENGMPRMTPRLEEDMSPKANGGPSVPSHTKKRRHISQQY